MIDLESFYNAATELFKNISEIDISSTRYSDSSTEILKKLKKKHRQNDLRNLKCLYKLWMKTEVSKYCISFFTYLKIDNEQF